MRWEINKSSRRRDSPIKAFVLPDELQGTLVGIRNSGAVFSSTQQADEIMSRGIKIAARIINGHH
jgi:hypothetical protein